MNRDPHPIAVALGAEAVVAVVILALVAANSTAIAAYLERLLP